MLDLTAAAIFVILIPVGILHAYWGFGGTWPKSTEADLAATVVGTKGMTTMPGRRITLIVAVSIGAAAIWPLAWRGLINYPHFVPQTLVYLGMWALSGIFLLRGMGGLMIPLSMTSMPFSKLNRWIYSPLCVLLGLGYLWLVLSP